MIAWLAWAYVTRSIVVDAWAPVFFFCLSFALVFSERYERRPATSRKNAALVGSGGAPGVDACTQSHYASSS